MKCWKKGCNKIAKGIYCLNHQPKNCGFWKECEHFDKNNKQCTDSKNQRPTSHCLLTSKNQKSCRHFNEFKESISNNKVMGISQDQINKIKPSISGRVRAKAKGEKCV